MISRIHIANRRGARRYWSLPLILLTWLVIATPIVGAIVAINIVRRADRGLPPVPPIDELLGSLPQSNTVLAADGTIALELPFTDGDLVGHRTVVPYAAIPTILVQAVLAAEDVRFFNHHGVDFRAVARAAWVNYQARSVVEGASTITQQLARNLLPNAIGNERSYERKLREALLARRIEKIFSKQQVFEAYVNLAFLGSNAYGVAAAARIYFSKTLGELTVAEAALIAGLAQAPGRADPNKDLAAARARRDEVLDRMLRAGFIDTATHAAALATVIELNPPTVRYGLVTPWDTEIARSLLADGSLVDDNRGGLVVDLAAEPSLVAAATSIIKETTAKLADKEGPIPEAAVTLMDHRTGYVEGVIGGRDWGASKFDRARQACRQPGSAWKPIVYGAALLARAITAGTPLRDAPVAEYDEVQDVHWKPSNSGRRFRGVALAIDALAASLNAPAIDVLDRVGADRVVALARALGISSEVADVRPMALGASCVRPYELVRAFAIVARGGIPFDPVVIKRVRRRNQALLDRRDPRDPYLSAADRIDRFAATAGAEPAEAVFDPRVAFILVDMLKAVVQRGTATAARGLSFPVAGKTGTTNDNTDAWFVGFSGRVASGVWLGFDDPAHHLGRTSDGGRAALPVWKSILNLVEKGRPVADLATDPPAGLVQRRIDRETGLLAAPRAGGATDIWFLEGSEPVEEAASAGGAAFDVGRTIRDF